MKQINTLDEFKAKIKIWKLKTATADSVERTFYK